MSGPFDSSSHIGVGKFSNLQRDQVHKSKDTFSNKGNNPFSSNNQWKNENDWSEKNPFRKDNVYANDGREKEKPRFKRFADLKILNEYMMHMSNNTLPEDSRIEVLSQGEKGEIKNLLAYRIVKISLVPALMSLLMGIVLVFSDYFLLTLFSLLVYFAVLVRTFFYPAKIYYENVKLKTTRPAKLFFEEMDYWYKLSVVKVYLYTVIASIVLFVLSFYEDDMINLLIAYGSKLQNPHTREMIEGYINTINFSASLKAMAFLNIGMLVYYSKFANSEKAKAEKELNKRMKLIRNESISRVQQIQEDKNEIH